jgi:hypothetical protein
MWDSGERVSEIPTDLPGASNCTGSGVPCLKSWDGFPSYGSCNNELHLRFASNCGIPLVYTHRATVTPFRRSELGVSSVHIARDQDNQHVCHENALRIRSSIK